MHTNKYDPAFPTHDYFDEKLTGIVPGLTKREYFAAMALQGLLASGHKSFDIAAIEAVHASDVLIAELNKES